MSALIPLNVAVAETGIPRGTFRVWKHRGQLLPVACDIVTKAELYDVAEVMAAEAATLDERIRRMCLTYRDRPVTLTG